MSDTRWNKEHTDALVRKFDDLSFDPEAVDAAEIDAAFEELPSTSVLKMIELPKFRKHYREKAALFLVDKGLCGARKCEFFFACHRTLCVLTFCVFYSKDRTTSITSSSPKTSRHAI